MFTLHFTLKQHTPLIHFQSVQEGATLRATEVKPKLDKFLISKLIELNKNINDDLFIGKTKSLDYKLSFETEPSKRFNVRLAVSSKINRDNVAIFETPSFPTFLANMGGKKEEGELKNFSFYQEIKAQIFSWNKRLLDIINEHLEIFFILHNFGNRQNKGFGSFTLIKDKKPTKSVMDYLREQNIEFWYWQYQDTPDANHIFTDISIIYSLLKTGINFPNHSLKPKLDNRGNAIIVNGKPKMEPDETKKGAYSVYYKSFLYQYFIAITNNYGNEKRFIKEKFFNTHVRIPSNGQIKKYVRAVLGTAGFNEFKDKKRKGKVTFKSQAVERFESPIIFKVIDKHVYFFLNSALNRDIILNQEFSFSQITNLGQLTENISTPASFDWLDLLRKFQSYYNDLINSVDEYLFTLYENSDSRLPVVVNNIIDVLSSIEIKYSNI